MSTHKARARVYPVLENPIDGFDANPESGAALAHVIEVVPELSALLDFYSPDPKEIAVEVGMVSPHEEDGADDLDEVDFGPEEWFEPSVGLAAVQNALNALNADSHAISNALYDPALKQADVMGDLESIEQVLLLAQQYETRFRLAMDK